MLRKEYICSKGSYFTTKDPQFKKNVSRHVTTYIFLLTFIF